MSEFEGNEMEHNEVAISNNYQLGKGNTRVTEFSPKGDPDKLCVFVTNNMGIYSGHGGLSCFDKPKGP